MDEVRIWVARLLAALAFLGATVGLVVVVERALDGGGDGSSSPVATEPIDSVPLTTEPVDSGVAESESVAEPEFYRIRQGDTLEAIAARFGTSVEQLLTLNEGIDPLALAPGQRLRVA
jgi:LysM repeat protein